MPAPATTASPALWSRVQRVVPGLTTVTTYERSWFSRDLVAGLVLASLLVPQGMAYAELAGLPAITGLYTTMLCLIGYALFGPSRILVLGPDSSLGPMIAAVVTPLVLAGGDPGQAIVLASFLAILVGVVMILAGSFKLGFVADLLSHPTQLGYMNGLALTIVVGQLAKLLGFSTDADGFIDECIEFVKGVAAGDVNGVAAAVGVGSLLLILLLTRVLPKVPGVLVAVVLAALAVNVLDLEAEGVSVIGVLPEGLPSLAIPTVSLGDLGVLTVGAMAIALVALTDTISTASAFAARQGKQVDGNQEMVGIGAANVAAGLFQGFPVSTSGSRTAVAEQSGSRSQLTGVIGALVVAVLLVFFPWLMQYVPQPTLGAVVIAAALSLADLPATRRLWQQRRTEFALSVAAFLGVVLIGVLGGIVIAVALSILNVFRRLWMPYQAELGLVDEDLGLHDFERYPTAMEMPGLVVIRFDAPLIFANARTFREQVQRLIEEDSGLRWIVVAAEPITDVDTTAADMLRELDLWANERGVSLVFAEMKDPVRDKIERYELTDTISAEHFYPTIEAAVDQYRAETGASWRPRGSRWTEGDDR